MANGADATADTSEAVAESFDFDAHERNAISAYQRDFGLYTSFAETTKSILDGALRARTLSVHSIEARAKDVTSFGRKARIVSSTDENKPKYTHPLSEITDLAGIRVITFFQRDVEQVGSIVETEFDVIERSDKADLLEDDRLGYQSVHYLIKLKESRASLPEYAPYATRVCELQVRTILQHAWAEIQHDVQYKGAYTLPGALRRRFAALAGLLELADREFQAIEDARNEIVAQASKSIEAGDFVDIDITPESLKAYLDRRFGLDLRYGPASYQNLANTLYHLGFVKISQVDDSVHPYSEAYDDWISRYLHGRKQGQIQRFLDLLKVSLGYNYLARHPERGEYEFKYKATAELEKLNSPKIGREIGLYDPLAHPAWRKDAQIVESAL